MTQLTPNEQANAATRADAIDRLRAISRPTYLKARRDAVKAASLAGLQVTEIAAFLEMAEGTVRGDIRLINAQSEPGGSEAKTS
jgi:DNA-binding NarL/FixJ family response regulator